MVKLHRKDAKVAKETNSLAAKAAKDTKAARTENTKLTEKSRK